MLVIREAAGEILHGDGRGKLFSRLLRPLSIPALRQKQRVSNKTTWKTERLQLFLAKIHSENTVLHTKIRLRNVSRSGKIQHASSHNVLDCSP